MVALDAKLLRAKSVVFVDRLNRRIKQSNNRALYKTAALIRLEARQSMRIRQKASHPGQPPSAHTRGGLREINFHVTGNGAYIGPRKFPRSQFFNRPVPNIHERGGPAINYRRTRIVLTRYPERSFMYRAVKTLARKGKLNSQFSYSLRSF